MLFEEHNEVAVAVVSVQHCIGDGGDCSHQPD